MRELLIRVLRRSIPVAMILAIMGYAFAEIFLMLHRMNGGVPDPANDSVRWRAPFTMAAIGVGLQVMIELALFAIRRNRPAKTNSSHTAEAATMIDDRADYPSGAAGS